MANLLGQRFGRLTVIKDLGSKNNRKLWLCKCDCGNLKECTTTALRRKDGNTQSCGCLQKERTSEASIKDITGMRSGRLVAIRPTEKRSSNNQVIWECKCDCGNTHYVSGSLISRQKVQSCGCLISKGNQKIQSILEKNNFPFISEYPIRIDNKNYFFDFALFDEQDNLKCLIEYVGIQHFSNPKNSKWGTAEEIQKRDSIKTQWCKEKELPLIRIPYTDFDKLDINYIKGRLLEYGILCSSNKAE